MRYSGNYPDGMYRAVRRFETFVGAKAYVESNMSERMYIVELKAKTQLVKEPSLRLFTVE